MAELVACSSSNRLFRKVSKVVGSRDSNKVAGFKDSKAAGSRDSKAADSKVVGSRAYKAAGFRAYKVAGSRDSKVVVSRDSKVAVSKAGSRDSKAGGSKANPRDLKVAAARAVLGRRESVGLAESAELVGLEERDFRASADSKVLAEVSAESGAHSAVGKLASADSTASNYPPGKVC